MKKFEQQLKQKAHLNKIKNAKKTVLVPNKNMNRMSAARSQQAQVLLNLYEKKRFDSIPAYKLLKTAGLQQYTRGFIERGYGVKLGALSALSDKDKQKLYDDLKIMPGHTVKLDRLIQTISRHSYMQPQENLSSNFSSNQDEKSVKISKASSELQQNSFTEQPKSSKQFDKAANLQMNKLKLNEKYDPEFQKQLQRVFNQYTPNLNQKNKDKKGSVFAESSATSNKNINKVNEKRASSNKIKIDNKQPANEYEKKLQKIQNQYTPLGDNKDKKKKTFNQGINYNIDKKTPSITSADPSNKYSKTKYVPNARPQIDFKKKTIQNKTTVNTVKKAQTKAQILKIKSGMSNLGETSKRTKNINLGIDQPQQQLSTAKIMQINLQCDKIKSLYRSFDGSLMSSTIANIDIQQLVYAFAGYICSIVVPAPQIRIKQPDYQYTENDDKNISNEHETGNLQQSIDDEVGNILRESYLHPLYTQDPQIDEDIDNAEQTQGGNQQNLVNSEEDEQLQDLPQNQFLSVGEETKNLQASSVSSFLGGESYHFGLQQPLHIFDEPEPTELDYLKPTSDSVANFIKNIVLTAKMQRQIPIMAARYMQVFIKNTGLVLTSLNYRRILVTLLLLASKIWDDESFESPSFSKTFPQYNTVLLNQMQKQVLKALDYKLKLDKKQYAQIYFQLRKYARKNLRSCQNKKISLQRIRQLQKGIKIEYKSNFLEKRPSF